MAIEGQAKRLRRKDITGLIATALEISEPDVPEGSTVGTPFLDDVVRAIGSEPDALGNTYRKIEFALNTFDEAYDPARDSSEHSDTGGGTITNAGYRKLLRGVTGQPQCFILNIADHPVSEQYADVPGQSYGFDKSVSGRLALLEAGPGARAIFYRTSKATEEPTQAFIAHAVIDELHAEGDESYRAFLADYQEFDAPVLQHDVAIKNWNRQHGIAEIDYPTLAAIVQAGTGTAVPDVGTGTDPEARPSAPIEAPVPASVRDDGEADRLLRSLGSPYAPADLASADPLPEILPALDGEPAPEVPTLLPTEGEPAPTEIGAAPNPPRKQGRGRRRLDRYVEERAVHIARLYLADQGWSLHRDCQKLGIGYDLAYQRDGDSLHVEVKGIQGASLSFNLTALEWGRVLMDPNFIVIAVTEVVRPAATRVHVVTRDRLAAATRRVVQFRLDME